VSIERAYMGHRIGDY